MKKYDLNSKLTKKQISEMVVFDNKTNNVFVRKLSLFQYYQIEGVFPIKNEVVNQGNGEVTIQYLTKEKDKAIQLMKDLREYMKEEFKEEDDEIDIDNEDIDFHGASYGRRKNYTNGQYDNSWGENYGGSY